MSTYYESVKASNPRIWYGFDEDAGEFYTDAGDLTTSVIDQAPLAANVVDNPGTWFGGVGVNRARRLPAGVTPGIDTHKTLQSFNELSIEFFFKSDTASFVPIACAPLTTPSTLPTGVTNFDDYIHTSNNVALSLTIEEDLGVPRLSMVISSLDIANGSVGTLNDRSGSVREMSAKSESVAHLFDSEWHHVVVVWDAMDVPQDYHNIFTFYVDGVEVGVHEGYIRWPFRSLLSGNYGITRVSTDQPLNITGLEAPTTAYNAPYDVFYDEFSVYTSVLPQEVIESRQGLLSQLNTAWTEELVFPTVVWTDDFLQTAIEDDFAGAWQTIPDSYIISGTSSVLAGYQTDDSFSAYTVLNPSGSIKVNLVGTSLEDDEPTPGGITASRWFALAVDPSDVLSMSVTLSSLGSQGLITIYKQPGLESGEPPMMRFLEVVSGPSDEVIFNLDPYYEGYYFIQVGLVSGTGDDFTLTWGGADPGPGGTFATAIEIDGLVGMHPEVSSTNARLEPGEPVSPLGPAGTRSVWYKWTAPSAIPSSILFTILSDRSHDYAIEVFTGTEFIDLVSVYSDTSLSGFPHALQFDITPSEIYYIRLTTVDDGVPFYVIWNTPRQEFVAHDPVSHLRVTVHAGVKGWRSGKGTSYAANEMIVELPNRSGLQFQEALNVPGSGSLTIRQDDPVLRMFNPSLWPMDTSGSWDSKQVTWSQDPYDLLRFGNIIKFWMDETCVSAFLIRARETAIVDSSENAAKAIVVSGPTVHYLLHDFIVEHQRLEHGKEERVFNWASIAGSDDRWEVGGWFDSRGARDGEWQTYRRSWNHPINATGFKNPPGWDKSRDEPPKDRPKYALVLKKNPAWPDEKARWMWMDNKKRENQTDFPPPRIDIDGLHFYRTKAFNITKDNKRYRFSVYSDTRYWIYLDGELFMSGNGNENYKKFKQKNVWLDRGTNDNNPHTVAVLVDDGKEFKKGSKSKRRRRVDLDHNDAFLLTVQQINAKGNVVKDGTVLRSNKAAWYAWHGEDPPGWSRAMILAQLIREAKERGNDSALALTMRNNFGQVSDEGARWPDEKGVNTAIEVGTSVLDVQAGFSETLQFDFWVDPDDLSVHAWSGGKNLVYPRGEDKSQNVALVPGSNLINWTTTEVDDVTNTLLVQYKGGYTHSENRDSSGKYGAREGFLEMGIYTTEGAARKYGNALLSGALGMDSSVSGSSDIITHRNESYQGSVIPVRGAVPFLDWNVGDTISAPSTNTLLRPHRVLSISCTEDEGGNLTFDPELAPWPVIYDEYN